MVWPHRKEWNTNRPDGKVSSLCMSQTKKVFGAARTKRFSLWTCWMITRTADTLSRVNLKLLLDGRDDVGDMQRFPATSVLPL